MRLLCAAILPFPITANQLIFSQLYQLKCYLCYQTHTIVQITLIGGLQWLSNFLYKYRGKRFLSSDLKQNQPEIVKLLKMNSLKCCAIIAFITCFAAAEFGAVKYARSKRDASDEPRDDQKSLLIIFDSTGSMVPHIVQMRIAAKQIVNFFADRDDKPIYNYILSVFNDPSKINSVSSTVKDILTH